VPPRPTVLPRWSAGANPLVGDFAIRKVLGWSMPGWSRPTSASSRSWMVPTRCPSDWVVEETARVLGVSRQVVDLRMLVSLRDHWAFRGDPAVPDPTRRDPRLVRWDRIDVAVDDQTLRIEFIHGVVDGLHHVEVYEDDEEVRVTVFLGLNHVFRGGGQVLMGLLAWTNAKTNQPVGRRYINDGADSRGP
jgi:hypothetical protein